MEPRYPKDSRLPHPGIHQAKVDKRLNTIEANATNIKNNFVGHTRSMLERLEAIEARLKEIEEPKPTPVNRWDELHPYAQTLVSQLINHLASTQ